jgi:hypothetical protein
LRGLEDQFVGLRRHLGNLGEVLKRLEVRERADQVIVNDGMGRIQNAFEMLEVRELLLEDMTNTTIEDIKQNAQNIQLTSSELAAVETVTTQVPGLVGLTTLLAHGLSELSVAVTAAIADITTIQDNRAALSKTVSSKASKADVDRLKFQLDRTNERLLALADSEQALAAKRQSQLSFSALPSWVNPKVKVVILERLLLSKSKGRNPLSFDFSRKVLEYHWVRLKVNHDDTSFKYQRPRDEIQKQFAKIVTRVEMMPKEVEMMVTYAKQKPAATITDFTIGEDLVPSGNEGKYVGGHCYESVSFDRFTSATTNSASFLPVNFPEVQVTAPHPEKSVISIFAEVLSMALSVGTSIAINQIPRIARSIKAEISDLKHVSTTLEKIEQLGIDSDRMVDNFVDDLKLKLEVSKLANSASPADYRTFDQSTSHVNNDVFVREESAFTTVSGIVSGSDENVIDDGGWVYSPSSRGKQHFYQGNRTFPGDDIWERFSTRVGTKEVPANSSLFFGNSVLFDANINLNLAVAKQAGILVSWKNSSVDVIPSQAEADVVCLNGKIAAVYDYATNSWVTY